MTTIETAEAVPGTSASILAALWQASLPSEQEIRRGRRRVQAKAASIIIMIVASYWALVIADFALWARVPAAAALVAALVATGTSIMHDANHGAFSSRRWINRVASCSADFLGASSWLWRFKHNRLHHGNTNVDAFDSDIAQEPFARLAPCQQWRPWHQWQHVYLWFLYGFFALKNVIFGDVRNLVENRIGKQPLPADMRRATVVRLLVGKVVHISWAVVIPMLFNPWWKVVLFYVTCSWLVGFALAVVFQLAHCVDIAGFPDEGAGRRGADFLEHQLLTTVDIASPMPVLGHAFRWMVGGLDHQIEHHMAPRLPHTVYPLVARRFHALCNDAGVTVRLHTGVWAALCSHTRWLMDMGPPPARGLTQHEPDESDSDEDPMTTASKPAKKSSRSKSAPQEPRTPSEEIAHEITSTFGDLAPSVQRILDAELSEPQRHRALSAFRGSLNAIGDPNRDPRYAIANCGADDAG